MLERGYGSEAEFRDGCVSCEPYSSRVRQRHAMVRVPWDVDGLGHFDDRATDRPGSSTSVWYCGLNRHERGMVDGLDV